MKTTPLLLAAGLLVTLVQAPAQVSIVPGGIYTENFDTLGSSSGGWGDDSTLPAWYAAYTNNSTGLNSYSGYTVSAGGSTTSTALFALGTSGSSERALGAAAVTTTKPLLAWRLVNGSSEVITNLVLTYDGEEWRCGTPVGSSISVSYQIFAAGTGSLGVGGWVDASASLTFVPPYAASAAAVDGNVAANRVAGLTASFPGIDLQPGQEIWFKWTFIKVSGATMVQGIDNVTLTVPKGSPPVIGAIPDLTVVAGLNSATNDFTVSDAEDDASSTPLPTPTATSSKESVLPSTNIFFGGSGANRTVYVVGGDTPGTADVTVTIADSDGNIGLQTFIVTVIPANLAPVISTPEPAHTLVNTPITVPFTVSDAETPASSLVVTGWVASYSGAILDTIAIDSDADGTNRTATITPANDADGVGIVSLSVSDPDEHTTTVSFAVMVLPAANAVFSEHFDYPLNTSILTSSPNFWTRRNSNAQSVNFRTASSDAQAWIRPKSSSDDIAAPLAQGPWQPGSGTVLYTMFKAQWVDVGDVPVVGDSSGPFILLAPDPTASADQLMQVATRTNGVPDTFFRLLISNGQSSYSEYALANLSLWTTYNVVVRYDVDTAQSTLWIDGTSETSPSVSAADGQAPAQAGYVCLRQEPDMGNIYLDDLKVLAIHKPLLSGITVPAGGNVEIYFTAGAGDTANDFEMEQAANAAGPFSSVSASFEAVEGTTFKATAPASGDQGFYRVKRKPLTF